MRELDPEKSTPGSPVHPLTRKVPVEPGRIEEYVLRVYPMAATILPGHRVTVELSCNEPMVDEHNSLLPPDAFHLPVGRPVTHKVYRDAEHPSRLVLPFTWADPPRREQWPRPRPGARPLVCPAGRAVRIRLSRARRPRPTRAGTPGSAAAPGPG